MTKSFASDNWAGVLPEVMAALQAANVGDVHAYGDDPYTERALALFREQFGADVQVFYVFNGTGANVVGMMPFLRTYEAIICAEKAHLDVDECGAPQRILGSRLLTVPTPDGKLTPALVATRLTRIGDQHHVQPRVVSIAQPTEIGTVYTPDEIRALADFAHANQLFLHIDGARFCNAAASLNCTFKELFTNTGADVLSFGGTKAGMMYGEAVILREADSRGEAMLYMRKQAMQLASKTRFIAAQFEALLRDNTGIRYAHNANAMARLLAQEAAKAPFVTINQPVQANGVFASLPAPIYTVLQTQFDFYSWDETKDEVRWMTAWDTTEADVRKFAAAILAQKE